jgi:7 transmembrane receptor (rhodopsin family).
MRYDEAQKHHTDEMLNSYTPLQLIEMVGLVLIFTVGIFGNTLTIYIFFVKVHKHSLKSFNLLLTILATVDLLSTIFMPGMFLYMSIVKWQQWHFGYLGCKILRSLPIFCISISQGVLIIIAYQRYQIVKRPLQANTLTKKRLLFLVLLSAFVAALLVSPWTFTLKLVTNKQRGMETCNSSSVEGSHLGKVLNLLFECFNLSRDILASIALLVLSKMTSQALSENKAFYKNSKVLRQRVIGVRKVLNTITIAFTIMVLPADLLHVSYNIMSLTMKMTPEMFKVILNLHVCLKLLQSSNSALNFLIYAKMKKDFRDILHSLTFFWRRSKEKRVDVKTITRQNNQQT